MVMDLDDDINAPRDGPREVVASGQGKRARRPPADEADAGNAGSAEAGIAATRIRRPAARGAIGVDENQGMMNDASIVGPEFDASDKGVLIEVQWKNKASKLVGAVGRQRKLRRQRQHPV